MIKVMLSTTTRKMMMMMMMIYNKYIDIEKMSRRMRGGRVYEVDGFVSVDKLVDFGVNKEDIAKLKKAGVYDCNYLKSFDPKGSALLQFFTTTEVHRINAASDLLLESMAAERAERKERDEWIDAYGCNAEDGWNQFKAERLAKKLEAERVAFDEGSSVELTDASGSKAGNLRKRMKSKKEEDDDLDDGFLFVNGLPSDVSQSQMVKFFNGCGALKKCDIQYEDGKCKGYAFVTFESPAGMASALTLNGSYIGSKKISVVIGTKDMHKVGGSRKAKGDASGGAIRRESKGDAKNRPY